MRHHYPLLLPLLALLATRTASANETCATAEVIPLTSTAECQNGNGTFGGNGTADISYNPPSCDATTNGIKDVWYAFNSDNNTTVNVYMGQLGMTDYAFAVYQGCGGPEVACALTPNGYVAVTTTPYTEYRIQVYSNLDYGSGGDFFVCAMWTAPPPQPPANNECGGGVSLSVGANCTWTNGTSSYATQSAVPITNLCDPQLVDNDDVWYRFVAPPAALTITVDGDGNGTTGYDAVFALAYAPDCGGPFNQLLACADATGPGGTESELVDFLIPGNTYYIRVFDAGVQNPVPGTFRICLQSANTTAMPDGALEPVRLVWSDAAMGHYRFQLPTGTHGALSLDVLDATGRLLSTVRSTPTADGMVDVHLPSCTTGSYVIALRSNAGQWLQRIVRL